MSIARMLALAFPERIGKSRGVPGQFLLANGRGPTLIRPILWRDPPFWSLRSCQDRRRRRVSCWQPQPMKATFLPRQSSHPGE